MKLPVMPPVRPMLAKATHELPDGDDLSFEPKWDGFRCIVFRDGDEVELGSRNDKPLTRYFPELLDPIRAQLPERCVIDGEVVVATGGQLDFGALQQRIHPAESRVTMLSEKTPASFVAFDLLALGADSLMETPYTKRRRQLERALKKAKPPLHLTPVTTDREVAADWFARFEGAGLDGVIAKAREGLYLENKRSQIKVKHKRTADCAVAGYRTHKSGDGIGSLLLGLYDGKNLNHVGVATSFTAARRVELVDELEAYERKALEGHPWRDWAEADQGGAEGARMPGAGNRWNAKKDMSWTPVRVELVVEVTYDHMEANRFRHATHMVRWRPDKEPAECTYDQIDVTPAIELAQVFSA